MSNITFNKFTDCCENIFLEQSRNKKRDIFYKYSESVDPEILKNSVYLIQGILTNISENLNFNLSEKILIKAISKYSKLGEEEVISIKNKFGDLGLTIYEIKNKYEKKIIEIDFDYVFNKLLIIVNEFGKGSQEKKINIITELFSECDSICSKYIVRIIDGNLRIGLSDKTILDAGRLLVKNQISYDQLENAYAVSSDLGKILYMCKINDIEGLRNIKPSIGTAISPQAAERINSSGEINLSEEKRLIVQPKYDGFRLQGQASKNGVFLFSRNLLNVTEMFPELKRIFNNILEKDIFKDVIFDGEVVVFNEKNNSYSSFQETATRKRKNNIDQFEITHPIKYIIFDILYLDGKSIINEPYFERLLIINDLLKKINNNIFVAVKSDYISSKEEIENLQIEYIKSGYEGIMIKKINSKYSPGKRTKDWIKYKKIQKSKLGDTIDVVVVGYYFGQGKRINQHIGAILVAVYDQKNDEYRTISKIGTGGNENLWKEIALLCSENQSLFKPNNVQCSKIHIPDVWCFPKLVVILKADSISISSEHTCKYGLRFPRLIGIAFDKKASQITTIEELEKIKN
jgi:DNA ligase-1